MSVRIFTAVPLFVLILLSGAVVPALADEPPRTNRLVHEKSPYLLQHAQNPVDWYPWGEEAFARAEEENKPVFLSIGYSTCHWCHVMANESFSDPGIAAILNEHFISIKVDREERPDVDALYLAYLEATSGGGGWPANLFLTPEGTPFFGGTYYPRTASDGMPGFEDVILRVAALWESRPESLEAAGEQTITLLESLAQPAPGEELPGRESLDRARSVIGRSYRSDSEGFGPAPRFPEPSLHAFLLRYAKRNDNGSAARMTLETLRAMARGGIHDQIGGGFHRYATDEHWRVPHFEKMLTDQAQMATLYFDAWRVSRDPELLRVGTGTLELVRREMTEPGGGFHSAIDAASSPAKGDAPVEGAYYTWTVDELVSLIPDEKRLELALDAFGIDAGGNVPGELDPSGDLEGANILHRERDLAALARDHEMSLEDARTALDDLRDLLFAARSERPRPLIDDKILTGWNGLMISALSTGFEATGNQRFLKAAIEAADFLEANLWDADTQTLWRRWREGEPGIRAFSEDYAFLIRGLLDLYGASFDIRWLELARDLQLRQDELFWSPDDGIYSMSGDRPDGVSIDLAGRIDSAMPSHNSISVFNLLELAQITGNDVWNDRAREILTAFGPRLSSAPASAAMMSAALDTALSKPKQIIVAGDPDRADTRAILELIRKRFLPDSLVLLADGGRGQEKLSEWLPSMESIRPIDGKATAYVCENFVCELPTNDLDEIARQLD